MENIEDQSKGNQHEVEIGSEGGQDQNLGTALSKLGSKKPEVVSEFLAMMSSGPSHNPLHKKFTEDHITKMLDIAANHDEREFKLYSQKPTE